MINPSSGGNVNPDQIYKLDMVSLVVGGHDV